MGNNNISPTPSPTPRKINLINLENPEKVSAEQKEPEASGFKRFFNKATEKAGNAAVKTGTFLFKPETAAPLAANAWPLNKVILPSLHQPQAWRKPMAAVKDYPRGNFSARWFEFKAKAVMPKVMNWLVNSDVADYSRSDIPAKAATLFSNDDGLTIKGFKTGDVFPKYDPYQGHKILFNTKKVSVPGFMQGNQFTAFPPESVIKPTVLNSSPVDAIAYHKRTGFTSIMEGGTLPQKGMSLFRADAVPASNKPTIFIEPKTNFVITNDGDIAIKGNRGGWAPAESVMATSGEGMLTVPAERALSPRKGWLESARASFDSPTIKSAVSEWNATKVAKWARRTGLLAALYLGWVGARADGDHAMANNVNYNRHKKVFFAFDAANIPLVGTYVITPTLGKGWNFGWGRETTKNLVGFVTGIIGGIIGSRIGAWAGLTIFGPPAVVSGAGAGAGAAAPTGELAAPITVPGGAAIGGVSAAAVGAGVGQIVGGAVGYTFGSWGTDHIWTAAFGENS